MVSLLKRVKGMNNSKGYMIKRINGFIKVIMLGGYSEMIYILYLIQYIKEHFVYEVFLTLFEN